MKGLLSRLLITSFSLLFFHSSLYAAAQTYTLDPTHTYVEWHINHFGFSNPSGKWMAEGTLILDEKKPQDSSVKVTIHPVSVVTGIPKLDEHLKGSDFLDVEKFPTATFVSQKIKLTGKDTAQVDGVLTLHGVSKQLTLNVKLNKMGMNMISNKQTAGFTANTKLNRSDYGMTKYLPGLGDEVSLHIEAEAQLAK